MQDFTFYRPTKIIFGNGVIRHLKEQFHPQQKILLLYGGGSIKKNGVYNDVIEMLDGLTWLEFGGIEPNPHYATCMEAVRLVQDNKIDYILAVGGGSVMDAAKFISLASQLTNTVDAWQEAVINSLQCSKALPIGVIPTLAATGSEMNQGFVISNVELSRKLNGVNPLVIPRFAIMDPRYTLSCDARQTSNGLADAYVHVLEQYLTSEKEETLSSRWAEGVLKTILKVAPRLMNNLQDLEARSIFMHAATMALNGMVSMGSIQDWATHRIGYDFSLLYGVDHARTLTSVYPQLLNVRKELKRERLIQYAKNVWGLSGDNDYLVEEAIVKTKAFFESIDMPIALTQLDLSHSDIDEVVDRLRTRGQSFGEDGLVDWQMAKEIFYLSLEI